jgi:hypothetical protein
MKNILGTKIGNVVNLVIDGNAYQKTFDNQEDANHFYRLMYKSKNGDAIAYDELLAKLVSKNRTKIHDLLEKDSDGNHYLAGIDIAIPTLLADTFLDYIANDFPLEALVNFWKLLVINPDTRVREDLFKFLQEFNFSITDNGYFNAYKAVEVKSADDLDIASFVSNQYLKIKKWKKNPANYVVIKVTSETIEEIANPEYDEDDYENDEPEFIEETKTDVTLKLVDVGNLKVDYQIDYLDTDEDKHEVIGNLSDLFKNIDTLVSNHTIYQSRHRGKDGKKVEQFLGVPVKMDRLNTDNDPKVECSNGLHVGSTTYVRRFANRDDKILLVLVNPTHVIAVPDYENSKMRVCEYFPYAELDRHEDGTFEVIEQPYFEEDYLKYEASEIENELERLVSSVGNPSKIQLDHKKILEDRLMTIEKALS